MLLSRLTAISCAQRLLFLTLAYAFSAARVDVDAQSPGRPTNLVTVQLAREGDVSIVTLEADGPLPEPTFGVAHDPFRFYVDFPNVAPESRGVLNSTDPLVVRVRVATYSTEPLISRVVLDLKRELPIRVDTDGRGAGRVRILVGMHKATTGARATTPAQASVPSVPSRPDSPPGPVTTPPAAPVQAPPVKPPTLPPAPQPQSQAPPAQASPAQAPPGQTPPVTPVTPPPQKTREPVTASPGGTSGTPPPPPGFNPLANPSPGTAKSQKGDDRYRTVVDGPLEQLRALRPLLASIDLLKTDALPGMPAAIERVESIRQSLAAVKPPPDRGPTHDMLLQSSTLAQRALKLRAAGSDQATLRNAGSAAAGALLLLDRVCIELGCDPSGVKR